MGQYFTNFYERMLPHIRDMKVEEFYGEVFSWHYGDADEACLDRSMLEKWVRGKRELPQKILLQAINSPDSAAEQYDSVLRNLANPDATHAYMRNAAEDSRIMLEKNMEEMLDSFPVQIGLDDKFLSSAKALTTALVYDGTIPDECRVEQGLRNAIKQKLADCQRDNFMFSVMYVIEILLVPPNRLLGKLLDKSGSGLKEKWESIVFSYAAKKHHKPFEPMSLNDIELVQWAKMLAYTNPAERSHIAMESDFCKALIRCKNSNTIRELKKDICSNLEPVKWDAVVEECKNEMYRTTI